MSTDKLEKSAWILTGFCVLCILSAEVLMWVGLVKQYSIFLTFKIPVCIMLVALMCTLTVNHIFNKIKLTRKELEDKSG